MDHGGSNTVHSDVVGQSDTRTGSCGSSSGIGCEVPESDHVATPLLDVTCLVVRELRRANSHEKPNGENCPFYLQQHILL